MSKEEQSIKVKGSKKFKSLRRLWRLFCLFVFLLFIWLIYCYATIIGHPYDDEVDDAQAIVVLGAALWNNRPSPALKERLDYALELYHLSDAKYIIVSGGRETPEQNLSEAEGMRNYLVEKGVQEANIIMEQHSTNTYENLQYTKMLADKNNIQSLIIVSHTYHAYRTNQIASYLGYEQYQVSGIESQVLNKPYHYTREVLAYSKWVLNSFSLKLGIYID